MLIMDLGSARYVGLDLGKRIFHLQLQDAEGKDLGSRSLRRGEVLEFFSALRPCTVAMEASVGASYWCDALAALGHRPLPLHARAVSRLRMGPKNDKKDAALILLAARLPDARPVVLKSREQLAALSQHRLRELVSRQERAGANQALGFLLEMGCVRWTTAAQLRSATPHELEQELQSMPAEMRRTISASLDRLREAHAAVGAISKHLRDWHASDARSQRLGEVPGIGLVAATALAASISDPPLGHLDAPLPHSLDWSQFNALLAACSAWGGSAVVVTSTYESASSWRAAALPCIAIARRRAHRASSTC